MTTTNQNETELCQERVLGRGLWDPSHPCGRKAKEDGLCGIHLRAKRIRLENAARRKAERDHDAAERERVNAELKEMGFENAKQMSHHIYPWDGPETVDYDNAFIPMSELRAVLSVARGEIS